MCKCLKYLFTAATIAWSHNQIIGATVAQGVMISMVITMGATLFKIRPRELQEMHEIVDAIVPALGSRFWANVIVGVSATGSSLVAALVVSITPAWSICELLAMERSYGRQYQELGNEEVVQKVRVQRRLPLPR